MIQSPAQGPISEYYHIIHYISMYEFWSDTFIQMIAEGEREREKESGRDV